MYLTIQGIVLRVTDYNDKDALLTMLTRRHGRLTVKARGLRRKNSPLIAPCQLLSYGEFTLFEYRGQYTINEAQSIELFTPLRRDLTKLSLGTYFAQVSEVLSQEDILRARSLAALLRTALDDIRKPYPPAGIEQSDTLWAVKFMSRKGEHVDVLFLDIDVYMTDRLNRVGMEDNTFLPAHRAYLGDGLNAAYLIVGVHDGHEASVLADSIGDLLSRNHAVFMHVQECDLEAFFFELFERMQNRVMLKCG